LGVADTGYAILLNRPWNFRSASYTHKEKNHDAQLSSQCFLGIVVFVDGGKNRDKCSVWLWQVTHGLQDLLARLAGVRLNSFNAMPALFLTVNRAVPKLPGKAGAGTRELAACSKQSQGRRSKRLPTVKDGYHGEVSK